MPSMLQKLTTTPKSPVGNRVSSSISPLWGGPASAFPAAPWKTPQIRWQKSSKTPAKPHIVKPRQPQIFLAPARPSRQWEKRRHMVIPGRHGPRLCPARRGISRSVSGSQAGLSISDAVIPAKLLRLVCDTAAVRAQVQQRSAAGSGGPCRFRARDSAQKLAAHACVRKHRRCCALPAQSMTRTGMTGVSSSRRALEPLKKCLSHDVQATHVTKTHNYAKIAGREPSFFQYQPPLGVPASAFPAAPCPPNSFAKICENPSKTAHRQAPSTPKKILAARPPLFWSVRVSPSSFELRVLQMARAPIM